MARLHTVHSLRALPDFKYFRLCPCGHILLGPLDFDYVQPISIMNQLTNINTTLTIQLSNVKVQQILKIFLFEIINFIYIEALQNNKILKIYIYQKYDHDESRSSKIATFFTIVLSFTIKSQIVIIFFKNQNQEKDSISKILILFFQHLKWQGLSIIIRIQQQNSILKIIFSLLLKYNNICQKQMSFWKAFNTVISNLSQKMSALNPLNNLMKYVIDRTFNEILSNQISIEKFKNGELILPEVQLNIVKINSEYLLSSPYILHSGKINILKIIIPHYSKLASQSFQLIVNGLQLEFIPNKHFAQNYRETMTSLMEEQIMDPIQQGGQTSDNDAPDFFRNLIKQIFINLKISLENTVIKQFINCPSQTPTSKIRYYLMYRVPKLYIGKSNDIVQKKNEIEEEQFKFDFLLPHLSVHLLKEGTKIPEFANQSESLDDFPLTYPTVNHPGTILLIGKSNFADQKEVTKLTIGIKINYKEEKKIFSMKGNINFLEATFDPIQLKILSRFIAQISQFQKIVKTVYAEFNQNLTPEEAANLNRSSKDNKSLAIDLFTSFSLMISEPNLINAANKKKAKPKPSAYQSMRYSTQMLQTANQFNKQVAAQLKNKGETNQNQQAIYKGYRNISFKNQLKANFQLGRLQINMLKFVTVSTYIRTWIADGAQSKVNLSFGCPHYQFVLQKFNYAYSMDRHDFTMKEVSIHDVRLSNFQSFRKSMDEQFYDVDSKDYGVSAEQNYFNQRQLLKEFQLNPHQHYCMEELFRISEGQSSPYKMQEIKKYAFMPKITKDKMGDGLEMSINTTTKVLMANVKQVAVMLNFQIWKDILNIVYPIFLYKSLGEKVNMVGSELKIETSEQQQQGSNTNQQKVAKIESQYNYEGNLLQQIQSKESNYLVNLKVNLIYCLYRQNQSIKSCDNFIEEVQKKILDSDNFSKDCFCNINQRSIYAQISNLEYDYKKGDFAFGIQKIRGGLLKIANSKIGQNNPFLIAEKIRVEQFIGPKAQVFTRMFFPQNMFNVELSEFITFIDMVKKSIYIVDSLLGFRRSLRSKIKLIQQKNINEESPEKKKEKKYRIFQLFFGEIELKMLLASISLRSVYFYKFKRQIQLKFNTLAIGFIKKIQTQLGQCVNDQMMTSSYPTTCKYLGIYDTNLILQIGRQSAYIVKKQKETKAKIRLQFFEELQQQKFSVCIFFNSNSKSKQSPSTMNKKAAFHKKQITQLSNIEEEQRNNQVIDILLSQPIYLHVCNLTFLMQEKKELEDIFVNVGRVINDIQNQSKEILTTSQTKQPVESEIEVECIENMISIKGGQLFLDFRPDYSYDSTAKVRMLSNLRMVSIIQINQCKLSINTDIQSYSLNLQVGIEGHFLHHEDKRIQLNPIFLNRSQLQLLGFQNIFNIDLFQIKGQLSLRKKYGCIDCRIQNVNLKTCLSSIPILNLFFQYFIQHNVNGNYGINRWEKQLFQNLGQKTSISAENVTDLDEEEQNLYQFVECKKQHFTKFKDQQYSIKINQEDNNFTFEIKSIFVGKIQLDLVGGNLFKFDKPQLPVIKRTRSQIPEISHHIFLKIEKIKVQAIIQSEIQMFCSFESLQSTYYFSRESTILYFWGSSVPYEFELIKIDIPLKALIKMSKDYLKVKINKFQMKVNVTDYLMTFIEQYQKAAKEIDNNLFKLNYPKQQPQDQKQMILLLIPDGKITASIELYKLNPIKDRLLTMDALTIHEYCSSSESIKQQIDKWLHSLMNNNMGTLISGAIFEALSFCTSLIIRIIRNILGWIFPFLR